VGALVHLCGSSVALQDGDAHAVAGLSKSGVKDVVTILAERVADAPTREAQADIVFKSAVLKVTPRADKTKAEQQQKKKRQSSAQQQAYGDFQRQVQQVLPHQYLAIRRGQADKQLRVAVVLDKVRLQKRLLQQHRQRIDMQPSRLMPNSPQRSRANNHNKADDGPPSTSCDEEEEEEEDDQVETEEAEGGGRGATTTSTTIPSPKCIKRRKHVLRAAISDACDRLLCPALRRAVKQRLGQAADAAAVRSFSSSLRSLLLQRPVRGAPILGLDPGFLHGCKFAVISETGTVLETGVIYPNPPRSDTAGAAATVRRLVARHGVLFAAVGNGTGHRECCAFLADLIRHARTKCGGCDAPAEARGGIAREAAATTVTATSGSDGGGGGGGGGGSSGGGRRGVLDAVDAVDAAVARLTFTVVSEAGASVYSVSAHAQLAMPELTAEVRGAVSIARRLLDPLAELVKVDPSAVGVGMYQKDVRPLDSWARARGVWEGGKSRGDAGLAGWLQLLDWRGLCGWRRWR
jgi:transcriptional accessory protein Tex/SPT6